MLMPLAMAAMFFKIGIHDYYSGRQGVIEVTGGSQYNQAAFRHFYSLSFRTRRKTRRNLLFLLCAGASSAFIPEYQNHRSGPQQSLRTGFLPSHPTSRRTRPYPEKKHTAQVSGPQSG